MKKFFKGPFDYQQSLIPPLVDLYESTDELIFKMDIPGIEPEDMLVKVYEDILIIEGIKRAPTESEPMRYLCMERRFQSFRRTLRLPVPVNTHMGRASYKEGVLTITFPKITDKIVRIKIERDED